MKYKRLLGIGLCACLLFGGLFGCGQSGTELPDLSALGEMTILSREDGSGTKEEFETLADTQEKGANLEVESTDEVKQTVAEDKNAIGYLAYSSISDDDTAVKLLKIDGVAPSQESVQDGSYPLCRKYYLAYSGELRDVEQDFLSYILSEGQDIVAETCIPIRDTETFLSDKSSGEITIVGSSSAADMVQQLAEAYMQLNPNASITVTASDSSRGLTAAIQGECDFAMSSRDLKDYESELLTAKAIATDGIAVAVNAENPLEDIASEQLTAIYDGQYTQWTDMQEQ